MNIIGPDTMIFGVDDLDGSIRYLSDYGLHKTEGGSHGATFEALDGTSVVVRHSSDRGLAKAVAPSPNVREVIHGVADAPSLQKIAAELTRDREVRQGSDGVLHSTDHDGYPIGFQLTQRRPIAPPHDLVNVPGQPPGRPVNQVAALDVIQCRPSTLSHYVVFSNDVKGAEKFYAERLGFRTVDFFVDAGPFMRPAGTFQHHTLLLIQADRLGLRQFTFLLSGPGELLKAGWDFVRKGYKPQWGPGRHLFGSNYFWYFASPFGGLMGFDADMDMHDDRWVPRHLPRNAESSQTFLLEFREKWAPPGK